MNILIEDAETLEYLTSNQLWTKNAATGKDFGATGAAFVVAKKELIGKFNIVERYPEFVPLCKSLKIRQRTR